MSGPLVILSILILIAAAVEETSVDVGLLHRSGQPYPLKIQGKCRPLSSGICTNGFLLVRVGTKKNFRENTAKIISVLRKMPMKVQKSRFSPKLFMAKITKKNFLVKIK
jgi:hypothetical protein